MNSRDPSLDDVAAFLAVLTAGGFRAAAKRLGVSASHLSGTVSRLEGQLGVPLLTRTTRAVVATEAGQALADGAAPLLAKTRVVLQDVASSRHEVRGRLKLNVPGAVMNEILPPMIDAFLGRYPAVRVEVVVEDRLVDAIAQGCDAGIRYGEHLAQDVITVPVGPKTQQLALAASPAYLKRCGTPAEPHDLLAHDCIRLRFSSGAFVTWELERESQVVVVDPPAHLILGVDAAPAAIALARAGHGVIATFRNYIEPDLQSGALLPVLPNWWQTFDGPRLYYSSRFTPAPLRAFIDFAAQWRMRA